MMIIVVSEIGSKFFKVLVLGGYLIFGLYEKLLS